MPFNKDISGYKNEYEFRDYLNNRLVKNLNPLFWDLFETLYGKLTGEEIIYARINPKKQKSDLFVTISGITKGISIKKGIKNSVHTETIYSFILFWLIKIFPVQI